jgi:type IV secretory pathway VirD2 relaxase
MAADDDPKFASYVYAAHKHSRTWRRHQRVKRATAGAPKPSAGAASRSRLFAAEHRVVAHVGRRRHLERDGVTRNGEKDRTFSAAEVRDDTVAFARRGLNDPHHFRFVVTPEYAGEMTDLGAFTRDLALQMEGDLGTRLDWVGIAHWSTDNPHVHPVVRGVADEGCDLVISRDYISHGPRSRAADLVSSELRSKPEREIRSALAREVEAERWTRFGLRLYQVRQPRVSVARSG